MADHCVDLRHLLEHSEGIKTVRENLKEGSVCDATDPDELSVSTRPTDNGQQELEDTAGANNHSKKHLKNVLWEKITKANNRKLAKNA